MHLRTMNKRLFPVALAALIAAAAAFAPPLVTAYAGDEEIARKALVEGRIRPLTEIIELLKPQLPGSTILGVELDVEDNGEITYEFDMLDGSGRLKEVEVDAATGKILKIEDDD